MIKAALLTLALVGTMPTLALAANPNANHLDVKLYKVTSDGKGDSIGTMRIQNNEEGALFKPDLKGLEPGLHGFHVHENASCNPADKDGKPTAAGAAGGHFNPDKGEHHGPFEKGHAGDVPALYVNNDGEATTPVLAPNLKFKDLTNRALVIHEGGDNYADSPKPLGGGGARVACGVITDD